MATPLPDHFDLGDVVLRQFTLDDVPSLSRAMTANLDHLAPWMFWATPDGVTRDAATAFVERSAANFVAGTETVFGIFAAPEDTILGSCGLHARGRVGTYEIGYWLCEDATGRGIVTRVVRALADGALRLSDVNRVEIRCDETNLPSAEVARRAGFSLEGVSATDRPQAPADTGRDQIWVRVDNDGP